ncbi:MAG: tRNA (cytidine(34)-2'-O)-methyltransferase [Bdellovibrionales bacterium]|nr:tRNA (cytidine(34)-2'-O)-methyltransferase [Bdellovibrionales bacterium]
MHIALVKPEIPQNTGSIARTCAATDTPLHLIGQLGFELSEKRVRRAGLDYWPWVELHQHQDWQSFSDAISPTRFWYISKFGTRSLYEPAFEENDTFVFGSETKGLGEDFLSSKDPDSILRIPMLNTHVRSLNLSNAVSIVLYEGLRQKLMTTR